MTLTSLFRSKTDNRIEALRQAIEQNKNEERWRVGFYERAEAIQREASSAADALKRDPSDETAEAFLNARRSLGDVDSLRAANNFAIPELQKRAFERTKDLVPGAIDACVEKLQAERDTVAKRDEETAIELGLTVGDTTSPVVAKLDAAIAQGKIWKTRAATAKSFSELSGAIQFCLS